jgi:hypothetical protein
MYTCGSRHVGESSFIRCSSSAVCINIICPRIVQCAP